MPVTVTVYEPEAVPVGTLIVSVEVLGAVTMLGDSVAVGPAGDTVAARLTVPAKPEMLVTVTVDVTDVPGAVLKDAGLAETLKFCGATATGTVTLWVIEVPAPVTVAAKFPLAGELTVRVVVTTLSGGRNRPASVVLPVRVPVVVVVKVMKSVKPPSLVRVMVAVAGVEAGVCSEAGLAVMVKSVWLEKLAFRVVSESGVPVPFETETWIRLRAVPGDSAWTLYVMLNKSPVPATSDPVLVAARWTTPTPSRLVHVEPWISAPSMHFARTVVPVPRMLPVRDASTAETTEWSALT